MAGAFLEASLEEEEKDKAEEEETATGASSPFTPFRLSSISSFQCTALVDALPGCHPGINAHRLPSALA